MSQYHFEPEGYLESMRAELSAFDELQAAVASASAGPEVRRILELGTGTGETTRRVLAVHLQAQLTGIDEGLPMLEQARAVLDPARIETLLVARLQEPLPAGTFVLGDVVVPDDPEDAVTPLTPGFDLPDHTSDLLEWLEAAGLPARVTWRCKDLAVLAGERR